MKALLVLLATAILGSCSNGSGPESDGDAEESSDTMTDQPADAPDGEPDWEPRPCSEDRECTDGDPCNGNEWCDTAAGLCAQGPALEDGIPCSMDPRRICLDERCVEPVCGDGYIDEAGEEFCEPPGVGDCDDRCLLICEDNADCADDGNRCNGVEYCNVDTSRCSRRDRPEDGTLCSLDPRGICLGGRCTQSICGDGFLDAGGEEFCEPPYEDSCTADCSRPCGGDPDCTDDGNMCNGVEYCNVDTARCSRRDPPAAGTVCSDDPRMLCLIGLCLPSICGDGWLDVETGEYCEPPGQDDCMGDCLMLCEGDPDCLDDGQVCNGEEYCNLDTSRCSRRNIPPEGTACDDGNFLTSPDTCDGHGSCIGGSGGLFEGAALIEVGEANAYAVMETGELWCWGANDQGQLGNGSLIDSSVPVPVDAFAARVADVAPGREHVCALLETGSVHCWGDNTWGQLGNGGTTDSSVPEEVPTLASGVTALASGVTHTCALLESGGVRCWGLNTYGQLGDGTTTRSGVPVDVLGLPPGIAALASGSNHSCVLLDSGGIRCWGSNTSGQLGDGTYTNRTQAVDVVGLSSAAAAVAPMAASTCALLDNGTVQCWGNNDSGQLGDGTIYERTSPGDVLGLSAGVAVLDGGSGHVCATLDSSALQCWGGNVGGMLGDGTISHATLPVDVFGLSSGVTAVSAGASSTCALVGEGGVLCWGSAEGGRLGDGLVEYPSPMAVGGLASTVSSLGAGGNHTCGLLDAGGVRCWGDGSWGQIGNGSELHAPGPVQVSGLASSVTGLAVGDTHSCALLDGGTVQCWGYPPGSSTPVEVAGLSSGASEIASRRSMTCALLDTGGIQCWTPTTEPADVTGFAAGIAAITVGGGHGCARLSTGAVQCWGNNNYGQLGDGTTAGSLTAVDVINLPGEITAVAAGANHACALSSAGGVLCWGWNNYGQLGIGSASATSPTPTDVVGLSSGVVALGAGHYHTCAATDAGAVLCWGQNDARQLGDGTTTRSNVPVGVVGLSTDLSSLTGGANHTCAVTTAGDALCWGSNIHGQASGWYPGYPHAVVAP